MSCYEQLNHKFAQREKILGTSIGILREPMLIEQFKRNDLDFLLFDMEHGRFDTQDLVTQLYICRLLKIPSIVRVQDSAYYLIAKTIDMGADGIMLPRVERTEQIETALDGLYFSPIGRKGRGGHGQFRKDEQFNQFQRYFLPQIESFKGIDILPKVLKKYGQYISGIIIGPSDMSIMVGTPLDIFSDIMKESVQKVFDICVQWNKSVGIYCNNADVAAEYYKMGANILWTAGEMDFLKMGLNLTFNALSKI